MSLAQIFCAAAPLLCVRGEEVNTVVLVYDKLKRMVRTCDTLDVDPLKNKSIFYTLEIIGRYPYITLK